MNTDTDSIASTLVTFPAGDTHGTGVVQLVRRGAGGRVLAVADRTPFHPLDHTWPDQPADRGIASVGGSRYVVENVVTGAVDLAGGTLFLDAEIPARRTDPDWAFLAVHVLNPDGASEGPMVGEAVEFTVDAEYREQLSAGHSACHLASLALNESLAGLWSKTPRTDSLGRPDFDQAAITRSRILASGAVDEYRLGKSLRKSGFAVEALAERLAEIQEAVNSRLADWISSDSRAWIECEGPELTARRWWSCELPEGLVRIPCGGTHVASTALLGSVAVDLQLDVEARTLVMRSHVSR